MARKRTGEIVESVEELERLEKEHRGKPAAARIRVFRLLKEDPALTIEDAAIAVGYSKQAVKRWLKMYREHGLSGLAQLRTLDRNSKYGEGAIELLKNKIDNGDFSSLFEISQWINRRRKDVVVVNGPTPSTIEAMGNSDSVGSMNISRVLNFLNSLPLAVDAQDWLKGARDAFLRLLPDVDRVGLWVNSECQISSGASNGIRIIVTQNVVEGSKNVSNTYKGKDLTEDMQIERFISHLRSGNFPFDDYHAPQCFLYSLDNGDYLGALLIWRERERPPISDATLQFIESLSGFIKFLLSDFVARYHYGKPGHQPFNEALVKLFEEHGLTSRERQMLLMLTLGLSYEEMSHSLNVSVNTVRYHLRSLYKKTGVRSQAELFAKYLTPRYDPH